MPNPSSPAAGGSFAPLRQPVFAVLWAAAVLGNVGSFMRDVASLFFNVINKMESVAAAYRTQRPVADVTLMTRALYVSRGSLSRHMTTNKATLIGCRCGNGGGGVILTTTLKQSNIFH